jgi:hypothetical protein
MCFQNFFLGKNLKFCHFFVISFENESKISQIQCLDHAIQLSTRKNAQKTFQKFEINFVENKIFEIFASKPLTKMKMHQK